MKKDKQLSILTFSLGIVLLAVGVVYEILDKPDGWKGIVAGAGALGISVFIFLFSRNRKE
jgi:hypothetical protein